MNLPEEKDEVWKLLDHASKVEPGPFFARNVVREVRLDAARGSDWIASVKSLLTPRTAAFGGLVAAAVAVALVVFSVPEGSNYDEVVNSQVETFDPASEFEEVEYRGQLMAVVDPGQLSDEALVDLFF